MVLLRKSQENNVVLTLQELALTSLPNNWLFVFSLEQNDGYTYKQQFIDVSQYPNSYNLFEIEEGVDITFEFEGDYFLWVYQMPNDTSTDETEGHLVHIGKMRLIEDETPRTEYTVNNEQAIYKRP